MRRKSTDEKPSPTRRFSIKIFPVGSGQRQDHETVYVGGQFIPVLGTAGGSKEESAQTAQNIERFLKRGGRKPAAAEQLPAGLPAAGVVQDGAVPSAGGSHPARPRSCNIQVRILASTDKEWLKSVMNSQDYTIGIRSLAQRRLAKLFRKPKS